MNRFLPAFYNPDWWYTHTTNYIFILIAAALVGIGTWSHPRRHERILRLAKGLLLLAAPVVLLAGFIQPDPPRKPLVFSARSLHRHFGLLQQDSVLASVKDHQAGIWTFGPYIKLAEGEYRVIFRLQSEAPPNVKVGGWDVTARAGRVRLASGEVMGTGGRRSATGGSFQITSAEQGYELETRLFFEDVADVLFVDVVIEPGN